MAYIPSLLNNCETWMEVDEETINKLDNLQNTMYRTLLSTPKSTPPPALAWDMGGISMKLRIMQKKLTFMHHIINLGKESLAKEIYNVQQKLPQKSKDFNSLCTRQDLQCKF